MLDGIIFEDEGRKPDGYVDEKQRDSIRALAKFVFADGATVRSITPPLPPLARYPEVVMSVPHSGTRTLVNWLGASASDQGLPGGTWWHFGSHLEYVRRFKDDRLQLNIPVRNPMDVAKSWATRGVAARRLTHLLAAYGQMFECIALVNGRYALYHMERLPAKRQGTSDTHRDVESGRIEIFQSTVMNLIVTPHRWFFEPMYPELFQ